MQEPMLWGDVLAFARTLAPHEYCDYFCGWPGLPLGWEKWEVRGKGVAWIAAYWVRGGSEGYYVHVGQVTLGVDERGREETAMTHMLIGKFWIPDHAAEAVRRLQAFVEGEDHSA